MLLNYLKTTLAVLLRRKFFTFVNIFAITFTLGVLLTVTAIFDYVFISSPPDIHGDRTVGIYRVTAEYKRDKGGIGTSSGFSSFHLLKELLPGLPGVERYSVHKVVWKAQVFFDNRRADLFVKYMDAKYWQLMQFNFLEGRPFTQDEFASASPVAVINRAVREKYFGNGQAVGRTIEIDGNRIHIVGVVENVPILRAVTTFSEVYLPYTLLSDYDQPHQVDGLWEATIRVNSKEDIPLMREEFVRRLGEYLAARPTYVNIFARPETVVDMVARTLLSFGKSTESMTWLLNLLFAGLAVMFMILPAVNLINLNTSRILERSGEIGVRKAFGASSLTLVGQFLAENILLTIVGGILGLAFAYLLLDFVVNAGLIPYGTFSVNYRVLLVGVLAVFVFGLLSGVLPAWRMSRMHPVDALKGGVL
ncbi:MAG: ABC transporter permease [bacterium]